MMHIFSACHIYEFLIGRLKPIFILHKSEIVIRLIKVKFSPRNSFEGSEPSQVLRTERCAIPIGCKFSVPMFSRTEKIVREKKC